MIAAKSDNSLHETSICGAAGMSAPTPPSTAAELAGESLIDYPCAFPVKVMGAKVDGFVHAMTALAQQFDPQFDPATVEIRPSKAGNYLGLTLTIWATSRAQLDGLYLALSAHPMVKVAL